mmetsp:Transcript_7455/g.18526  ORF Transcript_7455/g.18526 Transcript_7455/m.18526 type:complete len:571 (-) Transcript_7455:33-1745(-)
MDNHAAAAGAPATTRPHSFIVATPTAPTAPRSATPRVRTAPNARRSFTRTRRAADTQAEDRPHSSTSLVRAPPQRPADDGPRRPSRRPQAPVVHRRIQEVIDALGNTPWHIVVPIEFWGRCFYTVVNSMVTPPPRAFEVPVAAQAVIVVTGMRQHRAAQEFVIELLNFAERKPLVALLVPEDGQGDPREILEVQKAFRMHWVMDAIVQRSLGTDLRLDLAMCVRRAMDIRAEINSEVKKRLVDVDNTKFWPCIHRIFQGFPRMDSTNTTSPGTGARIGQIEMRTKIGKGAFSEVFLSTNTTTGATEAFKVVPKAKVADLAAASSLWSATNYLSSLDHPNIVSLLEVLHGVNHVYFRQEYAGMRNLYRYLQAFTDLSLATAAEVMSQIFSGVAYCHQAGVAHRDLKTENIVVMEPTEDGGNTLRVKIVGFGCAQHATALCDKLIGTLPFTAPEVVLRSAHEPARVDMWSCGIVLLELLCGVDFVVRSLRWAPPMPAGVLAARQLVAFFDEPGNLQRAIEAKIGAVHKDLLALAFALLNPSPQARWSADVAARCAWLTRPGGERTGASCIGL